MADEHVSQNLSENPDPQEKPSSGDDITPVGCKYSSHTLAGEFDAKHPKSGFLFSLQKRILRLVVVNPISAVILAQQAFPLKSELG